MEGLSLRNLPVKCSAYLVVGHIIVGAQPLDLHGTQHPADVVDDVDIRSASL